MEIFYDTFISGPYSRLNLDPNGIRLCHDALHDPLER